jgi:purine catabolism regulatory family protein/PucR-like helix-turn-helix protein/diguanylate cyclase with GGDEF domain
VTLRELVGLRHLHLDVVVDAGGLDRPIRWVYATELDDPTPYLRGGELVLTNGLWQRNGTAAGDFVATLVDQEVCGLGYGLEAVTAVPTDALVDACQAQGLPLLTVSNPVSFGAISQALADRAAEERQTALLYALRRNKALVEAIAEGSGMDGVLDVLGAEQSISPSLHDQTGGVLTSSGAAPSPAERLAVAETIARAPHYPADIELEDGARGVLFAVPRDRPRAFLLCRKGLDQLTPEERAVIDQTVTFLGLVFAQRRAIQTLEMRFAADLIDQIDTGESQSADPRARLEVYGLDPDGPLVVVALHATAGIALLGDVAAAQFAAHGAPAVLAESGTDVVVIAAWWDSEQALHAAVRDLAARARGAVGGADVSVGVGSIQPGSARLRRSLVEARHACAAARRDRSGPRVLTYQQSASHRHLFALHEGEVRTAFTAAVLRPLIEHDAHHRGSLVETLGAFLDNTGQWKKTAAELHVHVNTLRHRLSRIEQLTGRDMNRMDDRVDFYVALGELQLGATGIADRV